MKFKKLQASKLTKIKFEYNFPRLFYTVEIMFKAFFEKICHIYWKCFNTNILSLTIFVKNFLSLSEEWRLRLETDRDWCSQCVTSGTDPKGMKQGDSELMQSGKLRCEQSYVKSGNTWKISRFSPLWKNIERFSTSARCWKAVAAAGVKLLASMHTLREMQIRILLPHLNTFPRQKKWRFVSASNGKRFSREMYYILVF